MRALGKRAERIGYNGKHWTGAFALAFHGVPSSTCDIDILVRTSAENAARVEEVLRELSFASLGLSATDFLHLNREIQLGHPPNRIDLLTSATGVTFEEAWDCCVSGDLQGIPVRFLGRQPLIRNKRATGRTQDKADLEALGAAVN